MLSLFLCVVVRVCGGLRLFVYADAAVASVQTSALVLLLFLFVFILLRCCCMMMPMVVMLFLLVFVVLGSLLWIVGVLVLSFQLWDRHRLTSPRALAI